MSSRKYPYRILHVVDDFSLQNTGVTSTVSELSSWQANCCEWVGVYTPDLSILVSPKGVHILKHHFCKYTPHWRYPTEGVDELVQLITSLKITHLHIHEFWRAGYVVGMLASKKTRVKTILSAHGSTAYWALEGQGFLKFSKKWLYWNLFAKYLLAKELILHAITVLELCDMAKFFGKLNQILIPNAMLVLPSPKELKMQQQILRRFVFLGRLHPVKGVEFLIEAFSRAQFDGGWELFIAGPEEIPSYSKRIKNLASSSEKSNQIHFLGSIYGDEKINLLKTAWVVVVPSRTEVVGMVNLEAAFLETPTITTSATGLVDWALFGGILIDDGVISLQHALEESASWTIEERLSRGSQISKHVSSNYSLEAVGKKWIQLFHQAT